MQDLPDVRQHEHRERLVKILKGKLSNKDTITRCNHGCFLMLQ